MAAWEEQRWEEQGWETQRWEEGQHWDAREHADDVAWTSHWDSCWRSEKTTPLDSDRDSDQTDHVPWISLGSDATIMELRSSIEAMQTQLHEQQQVHEQRMQTQIHSTNALLRGCRDLRGCVAELERCREQQASVLSSVIAEQ